MFPLKILKTKIKNNRPCCFIFIRFNPLKKEKKNRKELLFFDRSITGFNA